MTLVRWSPYRNLLNMNREVENLFEEFLGTARCRQGDSESVLSWIPNVDLSEDKDGYTLKAELPGISKEDVKVTLTNDLLTISGEKKTEKDVKEENAHHRERIFGSFCRSFQLPAPVHAEKIQAEYRDGILSLNIPKAESVKPKEIEIK